MNQDGSPGRLVRTPCEDRRKLVEDNTFVYTRRVKQLPEDSPVVDVLQKTDLVIKDGEEVLFNKKSCRRLNSLSINRVASSWEDPQVANFNSWAGMPAPLILYEGSQEGQNSMIGDPNSEAPLAKADLILAEVGEEEPLNIVPIHVFSHSFLLPIFN